ncbi:MAG: HNH endonuclease [Chloroflexota bacterium]
MNTLNVYETRYFRRFIHAFSIAGYISLTVVTMILLHFNTQARDENKNLKFPEYDTFTTLLDYEFVMLLGLNVLLALPLFLLVCLLRESNPLHILGLTLTRKYGWKICLAALAVITLTFHVMANNHLLDMHSSGLRGEIELDYYFLFTFRVYRKYLAYWWIISTLHIGVMLGIILKVPEEDSHTIPENGIPMQRIHRFLPMIPLTVVAPVAVLWLIGGSPQFLLFDLVLNCLIVYGLFRYFSRDVQLPGGRESVKFLGLVPMIIIIMTGTGLNTWNALGTCPNKHEYPDHILYSVVMDTIPVVGDIKAVTEFWHGCDGVSNAPIGSFRLLGLLTVISPFEVVEDIVVGGAEATLKGADNLISAGVRGVGEAISHGADDAVEAATRGGGNAVDSVARAADGINPSLSKHAGCSFDARVLVWTDTGQKPIASLAGGFTVLGHYEAERTQDHFPVIMTHEHMDNNLMLVTITGGEVITTTTDHPFMTSFGWRIAGDLTTDSTLVAVNNGSIGVEAVALLEGEQVMYNLSVQTAETYFVGSAGVLVHNECPTFKTRDGKEVKIKIDNGGVHGDPVGKSEIMFTHGFPNFDRYSVANLQFKHGSLNGIHNSIHDDQLAFEALEKAYKTNKAYFSAKNPDLFRYLESINFQPKGWKLKKDKYPPEFSHLDGYTWHHHQDGRTMQLVRGDVHAATSHTGGAAFIKNDIDPQKNGIPLWVNEFSGRVVDYVE